MGQNDFKYILQDVMHVYLGARFSYVELMDTDEVPFKFKAIISQYMYKEVDPAMTLEDHMLCMKDSELSFMVYKQLKVKIKITYLTPNQLSGKHSQSRSQVYEFAAFISDVRGKTAPETYFIEEVTLSKFGLMSLSL